MVFRYTLRHVVPAAPQEVYDAWLSSRGHSAMTGLEAHVSAKVGAKFTACEDYITGTNIALVPGKKIVQAWRSKEFAPGDPDSEITVTFAPLKAGTRITLVHANVPDGHTGYRKSGWRDFYFRPMTRYFATLTAKAVAKTVRRAKKAKKKTARAKSRKPARKKR
jgi:activator of HSP90 ATPase